MINIKNLSLRFGKREILPLNELNIPDRGIHILSGDNGTGKSTLVRAVVGLHTDYSGDIRIDDEPVRNLSRSDISRKASYLPQSAETSPPVPVADFIRQGLYGDKPSRTDEIIAALNLKPFLERNYSELSGGQKQLCRIARTLCAKTAYTFLDEPDSYLSKKNKSLFLELIEELGKTQSVVIVTHADIFPYPVILELEEDL